MTGALVMMTFRVCLKEASARLKTNPVKTAVDRKKGSVPDVECVIQTTLGETFSPLNRDYELWEY